MEFLTDPNIYIGFFTLLALEVVLGVDNVVFISILAGKLPAEQQARARRLGLGLALGMRIILLFSLSFVIGLTSPLFSILGNEISGRDLVLIVGGLFLLAKATYEIHDKLEAEQAQGTGGVASALRRDRTSMTPRPGAVARPQVLIARVRTGENRTMRPANGTPHRARFSAGTPAPLSRTAPG